MLDIESSLKPRLNEIGASNALLAFLTGGCSKTAITDAANGVGRLSREVALRADAKLKQLERFVASCAPYKPDLRDGRAVESWLEEFEAREARAAKAAAAMPTADEIERDLMAQLICGRDPVELAQQMNIPLHEMSKRIQQASDRLAAQSQQLQASSVL